MIETFDHTKYYFLSNFCPSRIDVPGILFCPHVVYAMAPTVEHAYQACKAATSEDALAVLAEPTPGKAKRHGRDIVLRSDWDVVKDRVMLTLLRIKFADEPFKTWLLETDQEELVEGNTWHDQYWGNCLCAEHVSIPGLNKLGTTLMKVRTELQGEVYAK